jgi:hypothetical protein
MKLGTIASWPARSRGCCGRPRTSRYSGAAQAITSERARRRATKPPSSGRRPSVRIVTSKFSSTVSTGPGTDSSSEDARVARAEGLQVLGELVHRERGRAEHAQYAARLGGRGGRERFRLLDLGQHVAHALEVGLAGVGERQAARRPVEEAHAEVLLEVGDEAGDDGGRQVQLARRAGEAALLDHPREDAHRAQAIHGSLIVSVSAIRN